MKIKLKLLAAATVMIFSFSATANEKDDVKSAYAEWQKSLSSGKTSNVVNLYKDDAVLLATLADKPITNQADRTKYFDGLVSKIKMKVTPQEEHIRVLDEDNAVISGLYVFSFEQDGKKVEIPARYTFVYEKIDEKWLIVEHHSSKLPGNSK